MEEYKTNGQLKVQGDMTPQGADRAGFIVSLSTWLFGTAAVIAAISLYF
ncbi:hypothetical protein [Endozoicomonas montiporae]|uniref:Uncharacterized protein n=1 Tax=Endozoicomonas montiporae CL-33 TaxID=570277 RepID=A0A142BA45_9GAMM|nr:hypothetical protein [Endozoicomonas montiporae]AMO55621.1 hypothetical protein EZMO1_1450 [Endozoicomonas montiporae CL-33]AMO58105.1 hypothetical protein EZMO1_4181 [Endozoicomonas montiporae CL-33]